MNNSDMDIPAQPGRVLVVDDDPGSRRLMAQLLGKDGYELVFVPNGAAALEDAMREAPDVILLDVMMPEMDGFETCRHLRLDPLLGEVPIILVTSLSDRASRLRGLEAGADDFISKPVDGVELRVRVGNIVQLGRYRKLSQERIRTQRAEASSKTASFPNVAPSALPDPLPRRLSLISTGARAQFAVAISLISVIPLLAIAYLYVTGWLGLEVAMTQLWPAAVVMLPFMAMGYWMLAKYPVNIIRLRRYLEALTGGTLPDRVELMTDEDDLSAIQMLLSKVVKQTDERVHTIETQTEALLEAERQRVMIQSLGTACHHLGQPVTVICAYMDMTQRLQLPSEAQDMLKECRTAADALADVMQRLQLLTIYRTESYLPDAEGASGSAERTRIISVI